MKYSEHYKMRLPERGALEGQANDPADIEDLTHNFGILDAELARQKAEDVRLEREKAKRTELAAHVERADNPHGVTAAQAGAYTKAETDAQISGAVKAHAQRQDNPHAVTKEQVGLGKVPNVATDDQTPTYAAANAPAALSSGETLGAAFGKLAAAVTALIAHLADGVRHITAAERGAWNGKTTVSFSRSLASGTKIGTITIDGTKTDLYCEKDTNTVYTHPTKAGYKHIPAGGASGQILKWSADGTAAWAAEGSAIAAAASAAKLTTARTINGTAFDGTANIMTKYAYNLAVPVTNNAQYVTFYKHALSRADSNAVLLISAGIWPNKQNVYIVQVSTQGTNTARHIQSVTLIDGSIGSEQFGYYVDGDYFYLGLHFSTFSRGTITALKLPYNQEAVGIHYSGENSPSTGWTAITPHILQDELGQVQRLVPTKSLVANDDLNNYTTSGIFACGQEDVAKTIKNSPTVRAFILSCQIWSQSVLQIIWEWKAANDNKPRMWYRQKDSSTFGSWQQVYTTSNKPTPADIGAATATAASNAQTKADSAYNLASTANTAATNANNNANNRMPIGGGTFTGRVVAAVTYGYNDSVFNGIVRASNWGDTGNNVHYIAYLRK